MNTESQKVSFMLPIDSKTSFINKGKGPINLMLADPQEFCKEHSIKREQPLSYCKIYFVYSGQVSAL